MTNATEGKATLDARAEGSKSPGSRYVLAWFEVQIANTKLTSSAVQPLSLR